LVFLHDSTMNATRVQKLFVVSSCLPGYLYLYRYNSCRSFTYYEVKSRMKCKIPDVTPVADCSFGRHDHNGDNGASGSLPFAFASSQRLQGLQFQNLCS
jgi:hypothetical protein